MATAEATSAPVDQAALFPQAISEAISSCPSPPECPLSPVADVGHSRHAMSMIAAALLLASVSPPLLAHQVATAKGVEVSIGAVFTYPYQYIGRLVRLCGFQDKGFKSPKYVYQLSPTDGARLGIDVDDDTSAQQMPGAMVCYTGVIRRRDGLKEAELSPLQKHLTATHAVVNTAYFLAAG